jgi:hypothetical protein
MAGRILVDRPAGGTHDIFRRYNIKVDGEQVGKIRRGGQVSVEVAPGSHYVQARIDWVGSPAREANVIDGTDVHLMVRPAGNAFQALYQMTKHGYLKLESGEGPAC